MARKQRINPFYVLLILTGVAFVVTACAYGLLMVQTIDPDAAVSAENHPLLRWMDQYGFQALMIELAILAVATFAAIGTDSFWSGERTAGQPADERRGKPDTEPGAK